MELQRRKEGENKMLELLQMCTLFLFRDFTLLLLAEHIH